MAYLVKNGNWIKLKGAKYTFNQDGVSLNYNYYLYNIFSFNLS